MATDFEKNKMISSGGFIPNATDTPIDVRTRIETIGDMETIPNPYVGMEVYVKDEQCHYKVLSLKSKTINGVEVSNAVVDTSAKVVDLSGYLTESAAKGAYQPKGDYATVEALETAKSALATDIDGVREYAEEVEGAIEVAVSDHAKDSTVHVTEAERTKWNAMSGSGDVDLSGYATVASVEEISNKVAEVEEMANAVDEAIAEHENNGGIHVTETEKSAISIYPFDGIVYNAQEAVTAGYGIAYCSALGRFISVEGDSYKDLPLPYNSRADEYSDYKAVSGCLFRKGDELYSFNGETLVKKYAGADELSALETACAESVYVWEIDTAGGVMSVAERDKMLAAKAVVIKEGYGYYHPYYMSNETIMASHAYTDGESNAETGVIQEAIILLSAVEGDATMLNYTVKVCVKSIGSGGETADLSGYVEKIAFATSVGIEAGGYLQGGKYVAEASRVSDAIETLDDAVSSHAEDSTMHVTEAERTKWNAAAGVTYEYDESSGVLNIVTA